LVITSFLLLLASADALSAQNPPPPPPPPPSSPSRDAAPIDVVRAQMAALQRGDVATVWSFAAPTNRAATGPLPRFERMVRDDPNYAPLIGCSRWELVSALTRSERAFSARVRVAPAYSSAAPFAAARVAPLHYEWSLRRQGEADDDDDPEGPFSGCWMTETVMPDFDTPPESWDS
jgi:hypothetical protein